MLDSRYIHLHEALGLGPMWLNQHAHIARVTINPTRVATIATIPNPSQPLQNIAQPSEATQSNHNSNQSFIDTSPASTTNSPKQTIINQHKQNLPARLDTLKRLGSKIVTEPEETPIEQVTKPHHTTEEWQNILSGSIPQVKVMAMSVCASIEDVVAGSLFSGEDGQLLNKMLTAINLNIQQVYLNTWLKDLPDFIPQPTPEVVSAAFPRIQAEYNLANKPKLLLMGEFFKREDVQQKLQLLTTPENIFIIAHPIRIIKHPNLKRSTWETLQKLQKLI